MGNLKDYATGTVATAPSPATSGTSLVLESGEGARFPATPFSATAHPPGAFPTVDSAERIEVTNVTGDTFTITRAQGDTTAKSILEGWRISNTIFADDIPQTTADLPDSSDKRYVTDAELTVLGNTSGTNTGDIAWNEVTGTSQTASTNAGYIANNAGLVTITLPSSAAVGKVVRVAGLGAGGWKIAQNASQVINFGSVATTTGTGGSLASVNRYDTVELLCVATNNTWVVLSSQGNITVV
jgi:hypothetical protein